MTADEIAAFCLQLPGAREDLKWGSNRVFSVAGNKMFAILDFLGDGLAPTSSSARSIALASARRPISPAPTGSPW